MMFKNAVFVALAVARGASAQTQYTATAARAVAAARATALTLSPTSSVQGKTFDRFVSIWMENTDYDMAEGDENMQWLASQGILLTNYEGIQHPSQPNYVSSAGGSNFGIEDDNYYRIPNTTQTIVDLLEPAGVSWSLYQEDLPYSGFEGNYVNQTTGANDYVRKHNPLISYDSVTQDVNRLAKIKNFTMFYTDLENDQLPQWMFITPNMTNDGHDTSITTSAAWARSFLTPLLSDENFLSNTLVQLTFDETYLYIGPNRVFTILLGDAIDSSLHGTTDDTAYSHFSMLATVENNWDLGNLGEGDVGAAPFF